MTRWPASVLLLFVGCGGMPQTDAAVQVDGTSGDLTVVADGDVSRDLGSISRDLLLVPTDLACPVAVIECPLSPYPVTPCEANNGRPLRDSCGRYCVACGNGMDDCAFTVAGYQTICTGATCPNFGLCFP